MSSGLTVTLAPSISVTMAGSFTPGTDGSDVTPMVDTLGLGADGGVGAEGAIPTGGPGSDAGTTTGGCCLFWTKSACSRDGFNAMTVSMS